MIALEPEPRNLALLRMNLASTCCPNVSVLELAAYSAQGWMSLRTNEANRGDHKLAPAGQTDLPVRCVRLGTCSRAWSTSSRSTHRVRPRRHRGARGDHRTNPDIVIVSELSLRELFARGVDTLAVLEGYADLDLECSVLDARGPTPRCPVKRCCSARSVGVDEQTLVLRRGRGASG